MATSDVEICSAALTLLGDEPITALSDDTARARLAARHYPEVRDEILAAHPWNCALRRASLAQLAAAPAWGYAYAYQLPTDPYCLRVLETEDDEVKEPWTIEGRTLLTDAGSVNLRYIARVEDVTDWPPLLASAVVYALAAKLAYPVTGKASLADAMLKRAELELRRAKAMDGQEGSPRTYRSTALTEVR